MDLIPSPVPDSILLKASRLAALLPAVYAGAFVVAVMLNEFVFYFWGLNFLQVASATDVLMSGLNLFVRFFLVVMACAAGTYLSRFLPNEDYGFWLGNSIGLFTGVLTIVTIIYGRTFASTLILPCMLFGFGLTLPKFYISSGTIFRNGEVALMASLSLLFMALFYSLIHQQIRRGYEMRNLFIDGAPNCYGKVFWMGSNSVVLECERGQARSFMVMRGGEALRMRQAIVPPPNAHPPSLYVPL